MFHYSLTLTTTFDTTWDFVLLAFYGVIKCLELLLIISTVHFLLLIENLAKIVRQFISLMTDACSPRPELFVIIHGLNS